MEILVVIFIVVLVFGKLCIGLSVIGDNTTGTTAEDVRQIDLVEGVLFFRLLVLS